MIIPPTQEAMQAAMNSIRNLENQVTRVAVGHCKDCKWWSEFRNSYRIRKEVLGMGLCKNPKLGFCSFGELPANDVLCGGESLYTMTEPATGPLFGCIHFKEKAESTQ